MLRLTLAFLVVARSSALAPQPVLASSAAAVRSAAAVHGAAAVRSAVSMQVDWEARKAAKEAEEKAAYEALLKHLRTPIRQYEGGWGDTALRNGGKDATRFGTGPDGNLDKDFTEHEEEFVKDAMHAPLMENERRKTKSSAPTTLPPDKQEQCVLPEESFKVTKMEMSQTDEDFEIECAPGEEAELVIDIEPMFLMRTAYFYGFTADSGPKISIDHSMSSNIEGEMASKRCKPEDIEDVQINIKFRPESAGEVEAYLCFMFPTEKAFSKFYKITGKST